MALLSDNLFNHKKDDLNESRLVDPAFLNKTQLAKTGTTIICIPYQNGYIMASDNRVTGARERYYTDTKVVFEPIYSNALAMGIAGYALAMPIAKDMIKELALTFKNQLDLGLGELTPDAFFKLMYKEAEQGLKGQRSPLYGIIAEGSIGLLLFCNNKGQSEVRNFNFTGDSYKKLDPVMTIGSGSPFARGYLEKYFGSNTPKNLTLQQGLELLKQTFLFVGSQDPYSQLETPEMNYYYTTEKGLKQGTYPV